MEEIKQKLQALFESSNWSAEDRAWLLNYLENNDSSALQQIMQQQFTETLGKEEQLQPDSAKKMLESIREKLKRVNKPGKLFRINVLKRAVAAAVIIMLSAGAYFLFIHKREDKIAKTNPVTPSVNDIAPGGNKAVLTLGDGSTIVLDSANNGTLSQQGSAKVLKLDNGQLAYNSAGDATEVLYNSITTPRGGQYQLTLADGSKIWLNAASSLRYPASFTGKERKVELTGEAYFEVAKKAAMPFKVNVAGKGEVEVLGTHFNINSYADEASIKTTLLEGAVKFSNGTTVALLSPGQQAELKQNGQIAVNKNVELDEVIAWKDGVFSFDRLDIRSIMRQVSRWYDVDITYEGKISEDHFSGIVSRSKNISEVLKILEKSGIKFRMMEGNSPAEHGGKIIVVQ